MLAHEILPDFLSTVALREFQITIWARTNALQGGPFFTAAKGCTVLKAALEAGPAEIVVVERAAVAPSAGISLATQHPFFFVLPTFMRGLALLRQCRTLSRSERRITCRRSF
jgi:hypothetical protein